MAHNIIKSLFLLLVLLNLVSNCAHAAPQVPCFFIFGDSLADNGNNNNLVTAAKANYRPYGIDFPDGTTGRFTNGRTTVDMIGELLGFNQSIPPFATARGRDILVGVNYASGAAGIRDESGRQLGDRISLNEQLLNHAATINRLIQLLGTGKEATNYLNKCLFYVSLGSNDYLNNYFMPSYYTTSRIYTQDQYAKILIDQYSLQIRVGFRVIDTGCCPARSDGQCIQDSTPCQNRNEYVFWDAIHPTEAVNRFTASRSYNASLPSDAYPTDISHLVN
ncbi:hypothetical protein DKX38_028970 [Salix brachista]|uniref:SGNH hydrolase-type esterase domain-containing protein n=1 Tax=Salix brachista TaxID=2182728 RepID=A0A5N5IZK0_9ROSI|nr:hypothetical protein DKX38_028970 [Salix brachista]